jgi:hypothetical protein
MSVFHIGFTVSVDTAPRGNMILLATSALHTSESTELEIFVLSWH